MNKKVKKIIQQLAADRLITISKLKKLPAYPRYLRSAKRRVSIGEKKWWKCWLASTVNYKGKGLV